jgi:hypothetical protein
MSSRRIPNRSQLDLDRRTFLKTTGTAAIAAAVPSLGHASVAKKDAPEVYVKDLYETLTEAQRKEICFAWDYVDNASGRGLLRTHIANNWEITDKYIASSFYTKRQQELIRAIFEGLFQPEWVPKIEKQLLDDGGGYGVSQSIAIFGKPGNDKFQFVMTGRHLTARCDGNSTEHVAFGGPIFYGHAPGGVYEKVGHPGNVFWYQALEANKVYQMLEGKQRKRAVVPRRPIEAAVDFQGPGGAFPGLPVAEMTIDQIGQVERTLTGLLAPYRNADQERVRACLKAQGGLEKCSLAFYGDGQLGAGRAWDNWRLEGPSFVWYFRGEPHVHVWVNVADDPRVELNAGGVRGRRG